MSRQSPELIKNRSASQEFLFSSPQSAHIAGDERQPTPSDRRYPEGLPPPVPDKAGALERQGLIDATFASAARLCVAVLQFEAPAPQEQGDHVDAAAGTPNPQFLDAAVKAFEGGRSEGARCTPAEVGRPAPVCA